MTLGKLDIIIAADTAQIRKDMGTAVNIMQSSTQQMASVAKNAAGLIGGYFTFDLFKSQINQTLEFAESLNKLRQKTGISADSLYSLNAAAELADVSFEDMSKSLTKFSKAIGETSAGTGESRKAFERLGISIKNQDGTLKNSFDLLGEVADQFENMPDSASKATTAMALFGKAGTAMIPLLNEGKDSLREYLGVMDNETGIAAERFNDSIKKISLSTKNGLISIMKEAIPTLNDLSETFESVASKGGLLERNAKNIGDAINSSYTFIKDNRDVILSLGEAYIAYKASVLATTIAQNSFNSMQEYSAKITAQNTALTTASTEAERLGSIAVQTRILADAARREAQLSGLVMLEQHAVMLEKEALASERAAKAATIHSYELQGVTSKAGITSIAMSGLSTAFKTFAPTAILFGITEVFLNWDKITGNIKTNLVSASDQLEKMTNNQLTAQLDAYKNKITEINEEIQKLSPKSKGFSYFGALSEEDKTKAKAQIDTLKQQKEQIEKTVEEINYLKNNPKKEKASANATKGQDYGIPNENDLKKYNAALASQIQGLEKQFSIKTQIENLNIEAALRNDAITKPEAERLKEENDILSNIAKNKETINLLSTKQYDLNNENDKVVDQQKVNDLQKENELNQRKLIANQERYNATIKATNNDLKNQIYALNLSETDKQYADLVIKMQELTKAGADFNLTQEYGEKLAKKIASDDAYSHLQTELDIRSQIAEVSLYGTERENALEQIRHDGVIANLGKELETKKLNADEYLKLLAIENQRNAQNSSAMYKFMLDAFDNINKAMDENFFNAMQGKFHSFGDWLKNFFKNIGTSIAQGLSRTLAGSITNSLQSSLMGAMRGSYGTGISLGSLAIGSTVSASEIASIMNNGGTFDSASNSITTAGGSKINVGADGGGVISKGGSDLSSLVNTVSSLKTAYSVLTGGISSSIMSGFNGVADILAGQGYWSAASGLSNFGYGFANPFSYGGTGAFGSTMAGGALSAGLLGGAVGYGTGWLGDKLFGANTYAGIGGALGGATGGILASLGVVGGPLGIIAGSLIGSALGGIFGKKKTTDTGVQFFQNVGSSDTLNTDMIKGYADWQKKSWFRNKKGTDYSNLTPAQLKQIEGLFDTYDYLLKQLDDTDKIWLDAGKYSGESFQAQITKNFITAFTDINQTTDDTIYQAWKDYAESIDKTVTEAFTTSIGTFVSTKRTFDIWQVGADSVEGLQKKAQYAKEDFDNLANSLGVSGVTAENYLERYNSAVKESFTPETITSWKNLGDALMSSADAAKAYQQALDSISESNKSFTRNFELWNSSADTTAQLKLSSGFAEQDLESIKSKLGVQDVTVENFLELYKKATDGITDTSLIEQWQKLGSALMSATDAQKKYKEALGESDLSSLISSIDTFINSTKKITIFEQLTNAKKAFKDRVGTDFTSKDDLLAYAETLKKKEDLNAADIALYEALYNALNNYDEYIKNAKASIDEAIGEFDNKSALDKFKEAQEAFKAISGDSIDSESSLLKYAEVLKNKEDLTEEEIASYQKLASAMLTYKNELLSTYNDLKNTWSNISTSFKSAYDALNPKKLQTWDEISKTKLTTDNYQSVLDSIEATRQAQINSAQTASDAQITAIESASSARIDSLNKEKDALGNIIGLVDSLRSRIFESENTESYYKNELAKARLSPKDYNYSTLTSAANSYADYAKSTSTNALDYYRQVAKMSDEIGALKANFTAGTLEGIEAAIKAQEASLKASQYATTRAVQDATDEANKRASELLKKFAYDADTSVKYYTDLIAGLDKGDASIVLKLEEIKNAILDDTNITLGTKEIHPSDTNITLGEKVYSNLNALTASNTQKDTIIAELKNEIKNLREITLKNAAETTRMSTIIDRVCPDGDAMQVRITA